MFVKKISIADINHEEGEDRVVIFGFKNFKMEHVTFKVPHRIFNCIKNRYPGHQLINIKEEKDKKGHITYNLDLLCNGKYWHLKISDNGVITQEAAEPQFANDYHEQYF